MIIGDWKMQNGEREGAGIEENEKCKRNQRGEFGINDSHVLLYFSFFNLH
jgi:hypothetical protein